MCITRLSDDLTSSEHQGKNDPEFLRTPLKFLSYASYQQCVLPLAMALLLDEPHPLKLSGKVLQFLLASILHQTLSSQKELKALHPSIHHCLFPDHVHPFGVLHECDDLLPHDPPLLLNLVTGDLDIILNIIHVELRLKAKCLCVKAEAHLDC